jgi:hypothetical protein
MNDPTRALRAMLQLDTGANNQFPPNSRYNGSETATFTGPDGRPIVYLRRRFVPPSSELSVVQEHVVTEGDRIDTIAAKYLGDPELFWRVCDASGAMRPEDLTDTPGTRVQIALPQGVNGPSHA